MEFDGRVRELGKIAFEPLRDAVLNFDENIWQLNQLRQQRFKNVHSQTQSVVMIFCDGWPKLTVSKEAGWPHLAKTALPVMNDIIKQHYPIGGRVIRAMVAKMAPGSEIKRHFDNHPTFNIGHRIHVPLQTDKEVEFEVDDKILLMEQGQGYELNNLLMHQVKNNSKNDRIHFIFDYIPPRPPQKSQ